MLYHSKDNKILNLIGYSSFLIFTVTIITLSVALINENSKIPQKEVKLNIKIKDQINICTNKQEI
jgi:hypothetical protein